MRGVLAIVLAVVLGVAGCARGSKNVAMVFGGAGFAAIAVGAGMEEVRRDHSDSDSRGPGPGTLVMMGGTLILCVATIALVVAAITEPPPRPPPDDE